MALQKILTNFQESNVNRNLGIITGTALLTIAALGGGCKTASKDSSTLANNNDGSSTEVDFSRTFKTSSAVGNAIYTEPYTAKESEFTPTGCALKVAQINQGIGSNFIIGLRVTGPEGQVSSFNFEPKDFPNGDLFPPSGSLPEGFLWSTGQGLASGAISYNGKTLTIESHAQGQGLRHEVQQMVVTIQTNSDLSAVESIEYQVYSRKAFFESGLQNAKAVLIENVKCGEGEGFTSWEDTYPGSYQ